MTNFLSEQANLADLASHIREPDQALFHSFGHTQFEAAFRDRLFILYEPTGLTKDRQHRAPKIITQVKVMAFSADDQFGSEVLIKDLTTNDELWVGHVPARLWEYKVFFQVPPYSQLKWDGQASRDGVRRTLSFGLLVKTANRSDFYSCGNTYCLPPNKFRSLYPGVDVELA